MTQGSHGAPTVPPDGTSDAHRSNILVPALIGLAVVIVVAIVGSVAFIRYGQGGSTSLPSTPLTQLDATMPDELEPKFEIDGDRVFGEFGRITTMQSGQRIVQYDETGGERWSTDVPDHWIEPELLPEVDGFYPIQYWGDGAGNSWLLAFLDADTGEITDTEVEFNDGIDSWPGVAGGVLYVLTMDSISVYDSKTGEVRASLDGTELGVDEWSGLFYVRRGNDISAYDRYLQPVATDAAIGRRMEDLDNLTVGRIGVLEGTVVIIEQDRLVGYDEDGEAWTTETDLDAIAYFQSLGEGRWLLGSPDGTMAIVTGVGDDKVDVKWESSEYGLAERMSSDRFLLTGERSTVLIDRDGNSWYETDGTDFDAHLGLRNGLVVRRSTGVEHLLTFVDFNGDEQWTITTATDLQGLSFGDNAVFDPESGSLFGPK